MVKRLEDEYKRQNDSPQGALSISANPPKSASADGLIHSVLGGGDDDDDEEEEEENDLGNNLNNQDQSSTDKKKKRKNKQKKKKKRTGVNVKQTAPPRVTVNSLFPDSKYPEGEISQYTIKNDNLKRTTAEEIRHSQMAHNMDDDFLKDYRQAAEVHRQVRNYIQEIAKPGVTMTHLANEIDEGVRALVGHPGLEKGDALKAGLAFPTGLCLNHVAAHWTPNAGAKEIVLHSNDVLSVDFGVHVNGRIVDSAFTVASNPIYDNLLRAVKAATNTGVKEAGIDARISQISRDIQEVMESYEIELNGKTIPIKAMRSLTGHNILRYKIHGDKQVPFVKSKTSQIMEEGDVFAIETFGTTGRGYTRDDVGIYGYGRNENAYTGGLQSASAKALLKTIDDNFGTLVFAKRYLERLGVKNYLFSMKRLVDQGIMEAYGPLIDVPGSYVAQFEHTVLLRPNCKEVVSRGDDY